MTSPHLGHLLTDALAKHRERPVLELAGARLTGQQMAEQISRYRQAFAACGVSTGSAVGLLSPNRPEVLFVIGAGQCAGYRRTALHPLGSVSDQAFVLADAKVSTLVVDPVFADRARQLCDAVPSLTQVLTLGPAEFGQDLIALAETMTPTELVPVDLAADHVVSVTYTGGTTGRPKGVIGTAGSMAAMTKTQLAEWEWPPEPRFLMCTPLSHAGAAFFTPTVLLGGTLVVLPRFDPAEVLAAIERKRITAMMVVPTMLHALLDHPDAETRDLSSLACVYYGAAAMNPVRLQEAVRRFGPIFAQYYGQSECPMVISYLARADHDLTRPERFTSCGRPSSWLRTELRDSAGAPVAVGEPGEIWVSGDVLAAGYWDLPEQSAETFVDGWLRTGDVARVDAEGYWHIVDRTKDMIVTGGFNVFPREIEDVIATDPSVAQVAVIGTPDPKWGESVTALVVPRPGARIDAESIRALVKEAKGAVHVPKQVRTVDQIPVTALGKPDKKALRAQYA